MKARFFLYAFSLSKYLFTASDVKHFYHHFHGVADNLVLLSIALFGITLELFVMSPNAISSISLKFRRRVQLGLHIVLAINSLGWIIHDDKTIWSAIIFVFGLGINFFIVHKILHAVHDEELNRKRM